jgi:hypothetical protein
LGGLNHSKQVQYDKYDRNNDQRMDPSAGAGESWAYVTTEKAQQPKNQQNNDDCPQHKFLLLFFTTCGNLLGYRMAIRLEAKPIGRT